MSQFNFRKCLIASLFAGVASSAAASEFGCTGFETASDLPAIEGKDGVIFRIYADLRMYHPFSQTTVSQLGELSRALEAAGTTLIYVPIPTKSVTMPEYLPEAAQQYGFDLEIATHVHLDILQRLEQEGVQTADVRKAMMNAPEDDLPFFKADFHWSARGAMEAAIEIADVIQAHPTYKDLETREFKTVSTGEATAFSGMRRILQKKCKFALPEPITKTYETKAIESLDLSGGLTGLDLFGSEEDRIDVALLGTSFSDSSTNNFPGFLAQYAQLEVVNYAITGGNQFGAMTSYLTSEEFAESRPRFLIWENPIYNNLAQYGDQPMRELIASAEGNCTLPVSFQLNEDRRVMQVDLNDLGLTPDHTLFLDSSRSAGLQADFVFSSETGFERVKTITRGNRLRPTGRFYMPLTGLWEEGADRVKITLSEPFGQSPQLFVCPPINEIKS